MYSTSSVEDAGERRPNRCYESITKIQTMFHTVRVWRSEKDLFDACEADELGANADIVAAVKGKKSKREICLAIEKLPRIAAIEVTDRQTGDGALLYPDWK